MQTDIQFVERLVTRGLTRTQANRWYTFASRALEALEGAAELLATPLRWAELIAKVGGRAVGEPDITTELFFLFRERQEHASIDSPLRQYSIGCEEPIPAPNRSGKRTRDADLVISTLRYQSALRLVIESKLLRRKGDIRAAYLGEEGMGCFTCVDSPYTKSHVAGMAAYVRSQSAPAWEADIQSELAQMLPDPVEEVGTLTLDPAQRAFLFSNVCRNNLGLVPLLLLHRAFLFPQ